jgi:hypothetical protein
MLNGVDAVNVPSKAGRGPVLLILLGIALLAAGERIIAFLLLLRSLGVDVPGMLLR